MLSQMDPALATFCDKIAAQGGPVQVEDDDDSLLLPAAPVVQLASVPRTSARLRNVPPEVNLSQSYEALKRQKKNVENDLAGTFFFPLYSKSLFQLTNNVVKSLVNGFPVSVKIVHISCSSNPSNIPGNIYSLSIGMPYIYFDLKLLSKSFQAWGETIELLLLPLPIKIYQSQIIPKQG